MRPEDIINLVETFNRDKKIDRTLIFRAIERSLETAVKKQYGPHTEVSVVINEDSGDVRLEADGISVDVSELGRIAAQAAKQNIIQAIRDAEADVVFEEYKDRVGEIVAGAVARTESGGYVVNLSNAEGFLGKRDVIPGEHYRLGDRLRTVIKDVRREGSKVKIELSRTDPLFVRRLFELEVPEIAERLIDIKAIEREAGARTKLAVTSYDTRIDCVGACVGVRGARIKTIIDELSGEKIDIIRWNESPEVFLSNALKPAQISRIVLYPDEKKAVAIVPNDQLSLAIGRKGQNVRLATKLVRWEIELQTESQEKENELSMRCLFEQIEGVDRAISDELIEFGYETLEDILAGGLETLQSVDALSDEVAAGIYAWVENADFEAVKAASKAMYAQRAETELISDEQRLAAQLRGDATTAKQPRDPIAESAKAETDAMRRALFSDAPQAAPRDDAPEAAPRDDAPEAAAPANDGSESTETHEDEAQGSDGEESKETEGSDAAEASVSPVAPDS